MPEIHFNYNLARTAGYRINICKIGTTVSDPTLYYIKDNFPDVEITRPNVPTDLSLLDTKCLVTVNGYVHNTSYINNKLYIPNATLSMLKSKMPDIGILSFNDLSQSIIKTPILANMITSEAPYTLYQKAILTFPTPVQSPILSICGYMIFEHPDFFYRVSDGSFVLKLERLNYIEKIYELERYRNIFSDLGLTSVSGTSAIDAIAAVSDVTVIKFLTTYNSFLINIPVNNLYSTPVYLEHSNVPGNFRTELEPTKPIIVGYGKLGEYFKKKNNDTKYTVYLNDAYYDQFLLSSKNYTDINVYNNSRVTGSSYMLSHGYFLDIYTIT